MKIDIFISCKTKRQQIVEEVEVVEVEGEEGVSEGAMTRVLGSPGFISVTNFPMQRLLTHFSSSNVSMYLIYIKYAHTHSFCVLFCTNL